MNRINVCVTDIAPLHLYFPANRCGIKTEAILFLQRSGEVAFDQKLGELIPRPPILAERGKPALRKAGDNGSRGESLRPGLTIQRRAHLV